MLFTGFLRFISYDNIKEIVARVDIVVNKSINRNSVIITYLPRSQPIPP